ncbi:MAG: SDR family NAD(P)-dependent oxidoreductase [Nanoarchaeota archaeon]|nr:SDR family NAD(P)-dependent oxidoreductase [Nanoarchaeota archaeon]
MNSAVLITGSSNGLGKELALQYAKGGYDVIIHGRDENSLRGVMKIVLDLGVRCDAIKGDLRESSTLDSLVGCAREFCIDTLVNNAGMYLKKPALEITGEELRKIMEVNFEAPVKLTQEILPIFYKRGGGTIININSVAGRHGSLGEAAYCASKHALNGFFDSLRLENVGKGIRVINIVSGSINTRMIGERGDREKSIDPKEAAKFIVEATKKYSTLCPDEILMRKRE